MASGVLKEITNYDELKKCLEIIIKTYRDRDEKLRIWYEKYGFKIKGIITYPSTGEVAKMEYILK